MKRVSVTITVGSGSERHNHDIAYRDTLDHTTGEHDKIIELIPYRPYAEQINDFMKPFIDQRNAETEKKYQAAYQRFNEGKIKNKPKRKDYKFLDYDWYSAHKDDQVFNPHTGKNQQKKIWYSWIIGIGDQQDKSKISLEDARKVLESTVASIKKDFPNFVLLGATLHGDEKGFWHMHVDGMPVYYKDEINKQKGKSTKTRELPIGINMDSSLSGMGYKPEQSIMNKRDKAPILFNAMRNQMYREVETALNDVGLLLHYNASKDKEPDKDTSKNQKLENWQRTRDQTIELQNLKNNIIEAVNEEDTQQEMVEKTVEAIGQMSTLIDKCTNLEMNRITKKVSVPYHMFDQMQSIFTKFKTFIGSLINELSNLTKKVNDLQIINRNLKIKCEEQDTKLTNLFNETEKLKNELNQAEVERNDWKEASVDYELLSEQLQSKNGNLRNYLKVSQQLNSKEISNIEEYGERVAPVLDKKTTAHEKRRNIKEHRNDDKEL